MSPRTASNNSHRCLPQAQEDGENVADNDDIDNDAEEHFVFQAGHKFFLVYGPWIHSGEDLLKAKLNEHYKAEERFESDNNKAQGQLREIINLLQSKFERQAIKRRWIQKQFMSGFNAQRYNTATRIRRQCASILGVDEADILSGDTRKAKFREEIGWVSEKASYSSVDVPILHKDWAGKYSLSTAFLNLKLMGLYVALIRGPTAGKCLMLGKSYHPQTEIMARIHGIRNITPGAIATCGVLARWALSGDDTLQEVGSSTGINYFNDYEQYLEIFETGLRQKKKSIINVFKQWDEKIFPDSDSSLVRGTKAVDNSGLKKAMELLADDSVEEGTVKLP